MSDSTAHWAVLLADYQSWLAKQPLAQNTRRAYLVQVRQYGTYLQETPAAYGNPLRDPQARDYAVRDYKTYLKESNKKPGV